MTLIERIATETSRVVDAAMIHNRQQYNQETAADMMRAVSKIIEATGHAHDREAQRDIMHGIIQTALRLQAISQGIFQ